MKKIFQATHLLGYILKASHWRGHGVHSPFMYNFIRQTLMRASKQENAAAYYSAIKQVAPEKIQRSAYGSAPSNDYIAMRSLFKRISLSPKYGKLLNSIVKNHQPQRILELGSGLGVSSFYLANGNPNSHIVTVEGMDTYSTYAKKALAQLGFSNVSCINTSFDNFFEAIAPNEKFDLIFLDGSHTYADTLKYFDKSLQVASTNAFIILDDIRWSRGMYRAWSEIRRHEIVRVSADIGRFGILFLNPDLQRQEYTIRY